MPAKSKTILSEEELKSVADARAAARATFKRYRDDNGEPSSASDPGNPPLTDERLAKFRPASEVNPELVAARLRRGPGRPKPETAKEAISIRLDADVLGLLRASGTGWQSRINEMLRKQLLQQPSRPAGKK